MKRKFVVLFTLILAGVLGFAWGMGDLARASEPLKVGLVTDMGKIDDKTFNEYAYKGMLHAADELNFQTSFIETRQPTDYTKNIEQFVSEGFSVVITVGFMLADATRKMALKHPDVKFITVDFAFDPPLANVMGLVFSESQSGFLAGALAGLMSKSKVVGIVAGKEIPPVVRFKNAYAGGLAHVCPDCELLSVHIDSFSDPARGKAAALSQMDEGADVIFGAGGTTGSGAIMGAAQAGAWVIGVDQDEYMTTFRGGKVPGADKILSSAMKRIDIAVYDALKKVAGKEFKGGAAYFDAQNQGIGLAPFHETENAIPESVKNQLTDISKQLETGKIVP